MKIEKITILGGQDKSGEEELVNEVTFKMGDIVSIVGPTGCGKTTLINDIELYANKNTPTLRQILINGVIQPEELAIGDPSKNPIALISQHTSFLSDLPVGEFLEIHARVRGIEDTKHVVGEVLDFSNQLTGEAIIKGSAMTELSGGQTRSLLIADAVIIGNSPIILLDEIENAGIHRNRVLELLKKYKKIFIFVTHDPRIAMFSDFRIAMKNGGMRNIIVRDEVEIGIAKEIAKIDDLLFDVRNKLRAGERILSLSSKCVLS